MRRSFSGYCWLSGLAAALGGCAGGAPLMHPAHTLPREQVTFGAGLSSRLALDDTGDRVANGRAVAQPTASEPAGDVTVGEEPTFLAGALLDHSVALGVAPWVGGRVGLGDNYEGGLTYTGRSIRADARRSFEDPKWAVSVGLGGGMVLLEPGAGPDIEQPNDGRLHPSSFDFSATGYSIDLPVLVGLRPNQNRVFELWLGARVGFEKVLGELTLRQELQPLNEFEYGSTASASMEHFFGEGLFGLSLGVAPIWLRVETAVGFHTLTASVDFPQGAGEPANRRFDFSSLTLTPAAAVVVEF